MIGWQQTFKTIHIIGGDMTGATIVPLPLGIKGIQFDTSAGICGHFVLIILILTILMLPSRIESDPKTRLFLCI